MVSIFTHTRPTLQENYLRSVNENTFSGCMLLTELDLEDNNIESLSDTAFSGLKYLNTMELTNNYLPSIPIYALYEVHSSLQRLYLAGNPISTVPQRVFQDFDALVEVSFYNCSITSIEEEAFAEMHNLVELDLGDFLYRTYTKNTFITK